MKPNTGPQSRRVVPPVWFTAAFIAILVGLAVFLAYRSHKPPIEEFLGLSELSLETDCISSVRRMDCGESLGFEVDLAPGKFREVIDHIEKTRRVDTWERGGITYGEIDVGWNTGDDVVYARKELRSGTEIFATSARHSKLWYVRNPP